MRSPVEEKMLVTFWGTRGSISTPGRTTEKYGGNTPCVT
ncbi:MAG: MBL fold metallo-hydrolase, partial [Deltaproteobacteria bacterium]|nr:MBL fold metallo-hydrolase [Deltaproteobacteria bacterium]